MVTYDEVEDTYFADIPEEEVHEALKPPAPWAAGRYDATINEAKTFQGEGKDYPCVQLQVTVTNSEGRSKRLRTWVLSKKPTAKIFGLKFLQAVGLKNTEYRSPSQLVGLSGQVELKVKTGQDGVDRNEIAYFVNRR